MIGGASRAERLFRIPIGAKALAALVRDGLEPLHALEVDKAGDGLRDILREVGDHDHADERKLQNVCGQIRQRDGDQPEAAHVIKHTAQRIAAGAEYADDLHIGDVAEPDLQRTEHRHGQRRVKRQLRKIAAGGEDRNEGIAEKNDQPADDHAQKRDEHREAPRVLHTAPDLSAADRFADHDDAGISEANVKRKGQIGKGLENGHTGVVFIADVGIDHVDDQNTERPHTLVEHDGHSPAVKGAEVFQPEGCQLTDGADQQVFLEKREQQDQHRTEP